MVFMKQLLMKNFKLILFAGMACIWTGVVLRLAGVTVPSPYLFFCIGGGFKLAYLYWAYKQCIYKPGFELAFLAAGFFMLFLGIRVRLHDPESIFGFMLISKAVLMKVSFLFLVIRKLRAVRLQLAGAAVNGDRAVG